MKNIVLIGMPGVGKSTVGVILAKALGYQFIDSDLLIQTREKKLIRQIIEIEGNERFLEIENEVNRAIEETDSVIATGGSVVYGREAMEHFFQSAIVVYLKLDCETLKQRVGNIQNRGIVLGYDQTFYSLYEERVPLYEKYAHVTVDARGLEVGELMQKISMSISL
ncbi:MAG: shikimate kinase [Velocimicrobium sp.]